jgi:hypothetical protein
VAPFDHKYPFAGEEVSVTTVPGQMLSDPLAVTAGTEGVACALTGIGDEVALHVPLPAVTV